MGGAHSFGRGAKVTPSMTTTLFMGDSSIPTVTDEVVSLAMTAAVDTRRASTAALRARARISATATADPLAAASGLVAVLLYLL